MRNTLKGAPRRAQSQHHLKVTFGPPVFELSLLTEALTGCSSWGPSSTVKDASLVACIMYPPLGTGVLV
jgi:hypothetical protein